jgi:1-deoxy-D-xylulose 5-phosphate reductoisomerase
MDTGTNFVGTKFKQPAKQLSIEIKKVPVEAYNSISKVKRYYTPLRRAYKIIRIELKEERINDEVCLQIAVKVINNIAGLNSLVPTLLVFKAYPRITLANPPAPLIIKRSKAIQDIIRELRSL